ncbi:hypothetical protein K443DRAFT_538114 [Laccaria amethystina LaAM-08-1]|uniref:Uncharacterized protein n=1 Tax=Laccaria amethystina LaAM-08-1 TaxID=1095629 RepID=A0A0C9XKV1_9AGAR|nr:hypothetical protein K443DRAFT_538114 [Laccaria amethystina LaAM-08-1]
MPVQRYKTQLVLWIAGPLGISVVALCNLSYFAAASKEKSLVLVALWFLYCSRTSGARGRGDCCLDLWLCQRSFHIVLTGKGQSSARSGEYPPIQQGVGFKPAVWNSISRINFVSTFIVILVRPPLTSYFSPLDWTICIIVVFALSSGAAYNVISYPFVVINAIISFGPVYFSWRSLTSRDSSSPIPYPTAGLLIPERRPKRC